MQPDQTQKLTDSVIKTKFNANLEEAKKILAIDTLSEGQIRFFSTSEEFGTRITQDY